MLIPAHINHLTLAGYRPRTITARSQVLRAFEKTLTQGLTSATRLEIEAFLARPLAPESRRAYRSHIRAFYAWALDEGYTTVDPTLKVPAIRIPRAMPRPIDENDLARALSLASGRMRCWLLLMCLGGLRCIEVAALRPTDVLTTETGTLLYLRECKGGGTASVPAHPAILASLASQPIYMNGLWWDVTANSVSRSVGKFLASIGINATGHQLRHWAGTAWYRESGHDLLTTAALLRHGSVMTTMTYAQLDPSRSTAVVGLVAMPHAS